MSPADGFSAKDSLPTPCIIIHVDAPFKFNNIQYKYLLLSGGVLCRPLDIVSGPSSDTFYIINESGTSLLEYFPEQHVLTDVTDLKLNQYSGSVLSNSGQRILLLDKSGYCGTFHMDRQQLATKKLDIQCPESIDVYPVPPTKKQNQSTVRAANDHSPGGVCADKHGFFYVTDVNNNQILVFDRFFNHVTNLSTRSWFKDVLQTLLMYDTRVNGPISGPIDVTVTSSGLLVVLEQAGRVKVFCHKKSMRPAKMREKLLRGELSVRREVMHQLCSNICVVL